MRTEPHSDVNAYIALTDVLINLVLVLLMIVPCILLLGARGWEDVRYKTDQQKMEDAIVRSIPAGERPVRISRHDAPGEQRWVFNRVSMFRTDTPDPALLSAEGQALLRRFASVLKANPALWWRIRVESHVPQKRPQYDADDEEASLHVTAARAIAVSAFLFRDPACRIPPWRLTTSGRGHQDLFDTNRKQSGSNDRIDLLLIPPSVKNSFGEPAGP